MLASHQARVEVYTDVYQNPLPNPSPKKGGGAGKKGVFGAAKPPQTPRTHVLPSGEGGI